MDGLIRSIDPSTTNVLIPNYTYIIIMYLKLYPYKIDINYKLINNCQLKY